MKLEIELKEVSNVVNFLDGLTLAGLKGINRTKLTRHLVTILQEEAENEKALQKESKDKPKQWLEKELKDFYSQKIVVEGGKFLKPLEVIKAKIKEITSEESTYEFQGNDSAAAFVLYEAFNLGEGNE